jgi:hypothetical protein
VRERTRVREKDSDRSQMWWYTLVIPVLGRLRQEDGKLEAMLGYIVRP